MMTRNYTDKEKEIIAEKAKDLIPEELLLLLDEGRSLAGLYCYMSKNKIKCKRKKPEGPGLNLTEDEKQYIRDNCRKKTRNTLALDLRRASYTIKRFLESEGLRAMGSYRSRDYVPPPVKHKTFVFERKKVFTRPPAEYSNPDWPKMYL